jgi:exodeoxyribonuclease VII small subunit
MSKELTYTEAYNRLQEIIQAIENDKLNVDELSSRIKEATAMLNICKEKLFVIDEEIKKMMGDFTQ